MPYCSWVLAEMGADVVKLERPGRGDVIRGWDAAVRGLSTGFVWVNAGKRDLALDLGKPEGRGVARRLAAKADVFLENFAPGVAQRLGLSYPDLQRDHERLVYCSISGYGQTGPYANRKAYDLLIQGEAGLILTTGQPEAPAKVGLPITDLVAGTNAALAVVLFDSTLAWLGYYPQHYWADGSEPPRTGMRHQYLVPYGPYLASDERYVSLVVASEEDWRRFCAMVVRRPEWLADQRFAGSGSRTSHRAELEALVEAEISAEPAATWLERLEMAGLAYGEVRSIAEVVAHPQLTARRMAVSAESPVGELPLIRFPLAAADSKRRLPALGEHTDEVLQEAGYSRDEVARLRREGVVS